MGFNFDFFGSTLWIHTLTETFPNIRIAAPGLYEVSSYVRGRRYTNAPFHWPWFAAESDSGSNAAELLARRAKGGSFAANGKRLELLLPAADFSRSETNLLPCAPAQFFPVISLLEKKKYTKQFRTNLARLEQRFTEAEGFHFVELDGRKGLDEFYAILLRLYLRYHRSVPPPRRMLQRLVQNSDRISNIRLWGIRRGERLIAGSMFGISGTSAHQLWAAADLRFRSSGVSTHLLKKIIDELSSHFPDSPYLNLGPTPEADQGLLFSKSRWGAELLEYQAYGENGSRIALEKKSQKLAGFAFRLMPEAVFSKLARALYSQTA